MSGRPRGAGRSERERRRDMPALCGLAPVALVHVVSPATYGTMHQLDLPIEGRASIAGQQMQPQCRALMQRQNAVVASRDELGSLLTGEPRKHDNLDETLCLYSDSAAEGPADLQTLPQSTKFEPEQGRIVRRRHRRFITASAVSRPSPWCATSPRHERVAKRAGQALDARLVVQPSSCMAQQERTQGFRQFHQVIDKTV